MSKPSAERSASEIVGVMHKIAQENNPLGVRIGLVISEPPNLRIAVDNIILDPKDLYVDAFLCMGYQREYAGETTMNNVTGSLDMDVDGSGTYRYGGIDF